MIALLLYSAAIATAAPPPSVNMPGLIAGAEHAVRANRLDQARLMVSRAVSAGASGPQLARVLADLAFAEMRFDDASIRYRSLAGRFPLDELVLERAGISALKIGDAAHARPYLERATALPNASWRAWNARGVAADIGADWVDADSAYDHAAALAPDEVEPVNNRGWSLLLRGNWRDALAYFEKARQLDPNSVRIANNLELAQAALAAELPQRMPGESDFAWAARLNDAGVAAAILGDKARATAAFTEAMDARGTWYARAANNLEALGSR